MYILLLQISDESATLGEIATANNTTPDQLYAYFDRGQGGGPGGGGGGFGAVGGAGRGYGRMTLEQLCQSEGLDLQNALQLLRTANIDADAGDNVRSLSQAHNLMPVDLIEMMGGKKPVH